ncbi:adenosine deaminase [Streptomyces sp. NPDC007148]|uniref:adenosine deaminase n=1 Tax=Streptomyces sp. NPDC007148 TaxID=3364775 RepID=UPI003679BF29
MHPLPSSIASISADHSLRTLPKVSLHEHLDGCVRLDTLIDLSAAQGAPLPATNHEDLRTWFLAQSHSGSLVAYLQSFALTSAVMQSAENLRRIAREYVHDLAYDGVVYAEVRWAPEKMTAGGLGLDEAVDAVRTGLRIGMDEVAAVGSPVEVNQIITAMRAADRVDEVADLALRHQGNGVVAFDLAGPEAGYPTSLYRDAVERAARHHMPMTVHAGEADGLASIHSALYDGRALRLGHGVRIAEDINERGELGPLARWVRDRAIVLETSPTSNLHTGVFAAWGDTMRDHPFDALYRNHFQVTVNTDNRLMSDTTLTQELHVLQQTFGYSLDDLETFQLNAARGAFVDTARRAEISRIVRDGFARNRQRCA